MRSSVTLSSMDRSVHMNKFYGGRFRMVERRFGERNALWRTHCKRVWTTTARQNNVGLPDQTLVWTCAFCHYLHSASQWQWHELFTHLCCCWGGCAFSHPTQARSGFLLFLSSFLLLSFLHVSDFPTLLPAPASLC